jgi:hypothetical protein
MQEFHSINGVDFGNKVYIFATKFFLVRKKRKMWETMGNIERKFSWLKLMFEKRSSLRP